MAKATQQQMDVIRLIQRSPDCGDGWRSCSPALFESLISEMPEELVEKDAENSRVRLTSDGEVLAVWG